MVGLVKTRSCSNRVSLAAAAPTTRREISSCTAKISLNSVIGFRPEVASGFGIDQFNTNANAIARPADTAIEEITRIEQAPDLGRCDIATLELKARRFGRNQQLREATECADHLP